MATRSKETLVGCMKLEIQEAFKSEDFQKLLQSAIEEALNATIPKVIEPLTKTIVDLQEKVSSLESQL
jgi:ribosomal protein S3AE